MFAEAASVIPLLEMWEGEKITSAQLKIKWKQPKWHSTVTWSA